MPVNLVEHPLIRHKIGLMRAHDVTTKKFRELANELATLLTYITPYYPLLKSVLEENRACFNGLAFGFTVAGEDKVFHPAKGVINGQRVTVASAKVRAPVAARTRPGSTVKPCRGPESAPTTAP